MMAPFAAPPGGKKDRTYAQMALLGAVPAILIAAPGVGFFLGQWLDSKFHTEPYLLIAGIVMGFAAAVVEIRGLVKRAQSMDNEKDSK